MEHVESQSMKLEYIPTKEQIGNIFTKPLPRETFKYLINKLGIIFSSQFEEK